MTFLPLMESPCRPDVVKLPLPPGVKAGAVVGRGGHNVRWLHFHSGGAHITVNDTAITIRAKEDHVRERAVLLVQLQLGAARKLLGATHDDDLPPLPRPGFILLEAAFGTDPRASFSQRQDEVAAALGLRERLFELVPVTIPCSRDQDGQRDQDKASIGRDGNNAAGVHAAATAAAAAAVARALAGLGPKRRGNPPLLAAVGLALAAAAHKAACLEPAFDVLKLRFKLGKNLFRNLGPLADKTELSASDLAASSGRGAYQSVFSNYVPASTVPRVTSWLTDVLGFSLTDTKTTATLHVINQELNVHYSIALTMEGGDDSTASLRKLKVGGSKNPSVTLMSGPQQLDLRLKLITQFREHPGLMYDVDAHSTARRVAAAVRTEGFDGFIRSKRGLPRNRHLEYGRRKTKFVYEGFMPTSEGEGGCGQRLRVSVTQVQDDKGTHYEISGCLPDVDAKLRRLLAQHRSPPPSPPPPAASVDDSGCFVPEWRRRGGSSGGSSVGPGSSLGLAGDRVLYKRFRSSGGGPVGPSAGPCWARSISGGGGGVLHDSASSSLTASFSTSNPKPTCDAEGHVTAEWAEAALVACMVQELQDGLQRGVWR
ncbi:hypothetical protein VOLCADRAFT_105604 [Volvox carteri f. nagariensis]|uniref:K Homology domain-containing protein n=1 Tax=Volvox carteri f. nagariensis TaxID=3068 RepID=D8U1V0_VOLCA|nr:uncharacterized protein VOLCADRAFT_105604 [Volvox carteri f. nagariensis]EFJ46177.1 hypothetical protein VOLCADRAFT_105604 [Volvox carteri f. nagariensis]|eukprot:XP_002952624.1 hypothetical protein VOLCADRAFT_105604 [Volvox carteri f. nagariensis]